MVIVETELDICRCILFRRTLAGGSSDDIIMATAETRISYSKVLLTETRFLIDETPTRMGPIR